ncbi:outer membrane biogenesis protein BamB [Adhaeretor mobilis]|uniref:Outer membrane biogenesis protein BamB n=2 Tax=Adhaeretor mobilis TaxID=1930276 RepID=A0A517MWU8_9BACT|nr:outer membrane biogenesis protein BamB [Adhaeretor mobilis]
MPVVWVGGIALLCGGYLMTDAPEDVKNSVLWVATGIALAGLVVWVWRNSGLSGVGRWTAVLALILPVILFCTQALPIEVIHNGDVGIIGWRWRNSEADRQLAPAAVTAQISNTAPDVWEPADTDYPRFLGNGYWAEAKGVKLDTDKLAANPPVEKWRNKIGAGWSGFAVIGRRAITQEQRGEEELVTCYDIDTGALVWFHADAVRWDPRGGGAMGYEGPRATPTIHQDRVYSLGATGILNCLDLKSGEQIWSHDVLKENGAQNVMWGKSSSPLAFDGMIVVSVGGSNGHSLVSYDAGTGEPLWATGDARSSYASPVLTTLGGVRQILSLDEGIVKSVDAENGTELWRTDWPSNSDTDAAVSQPVPVGDDRVFLSMGYGRGATLLKVSQIDAGWTTEPLWKGGKRGVLPVMKTKMGNVVVHKGYVYGLDEAILECIDLNTGRKRWKKRRSPKLGHGQIVLVGNVLLVLSEYGEVVVVQASPEKYRELASFEAIEGITWNNPTLVGNLLLVRNAQEAACFELPVLPTSDETELDGDAAL